jgi:ubiquinone/menaquinone biosynthesis C-methylase UbiE
MVKKESGLAPGYLHGYSDEEQRRLYKQARFLETSVFEKIDFSKQQHVLEIGCGVGAQSEILLERFPTLTIQGVDSSQSQIDRAKKHLSQAIQAGKIQFEVGDAFNLPYAENSFDGAFVCWLLEHVKNPIGILREALRVMKAGSVIYCTEVQNATFYVHPYSPATLQYWFAFNDHQWSLEGDPFVGAKLGNYLTEAGFQNVKTEVRVLHFDNRSPKTRADLISYWTELLLSGAPGLLEAGKVTQEVVDEMKNELSRLKYASDAVFFYAYIQARAEVF